MQTELFPDEMIDNLFAPRALVGSTTARITCRVCELKDDVPLTHAPGPLCRACGTDIAATKIKVKQWLTGVLAQIDLELDRWADIQLSYPAFWAKIQEAEMKAGEDDAALAEALSRAHAAHPTYALLLDAQRDARRALEPLEAERARLEAALVLIDEITPQLGPGEYLIPAQADVESCRSCGASIVWTKTAAGKPVPLSLALVEERGGMRVTKTHFVDCPDGRGWKK